MKKLALLAIWLALPLLAPAQSSPVIGGVVQYVFTAPSGSCGAAPPIEVLYSTGAIYTCDNGTWAVQGGGGSGSVTSVGMTVPGVIFSVSGSPITTSGVLALSLLTQTANTVFAGPTTGSAAAPTFRALVAADIPSLSATYAVLSGANSFSSGLNTFSNSPGTGSGAYGTLFSGTPEGSSLFNPVVYISTVGATNPTWATQGPMLAVNAPSGYSTSAHLFEIALNGTLEAWQAGPTFNSGSIYATSGGVLSNGNFQTKSSNGYGITNGSPTSPIDTLFCRAGSGGIAAIESAATCTNTVAGGNAELALGNLVVTAAAPTVAASQVGFGGTVTANTNCGTLGTGCLVINVAGTTRYLTYY